MKAILYTTKVRLAVIDGGVRNEGANCVRNKYFLDVHADSYWSKSEWISYSRIILQHNILNKPSKQTKNKNINNNKTKDSSQLRIRDHKHDFCMISG